MLHFPFQQTFYFTLKCNIAVQNIVKKATLCIEESTSHGFSVPLFGNFLSFQHFILVHNGNIQVHHSKQNQGAEIYFAFFYLLFFYLLLQCYDDGNVRHRFLRKYLTFNLEIWCFF